MASHLMNSTHSHSSSGHTSWKERWLFLLQFLRKGTTIASVTPSSRWLSKAFVEGIDFESANVIVELGAGTGPVTVEILKRLRPGCVFIAVERDPAFFTMLRKRLPTVDLVEHDACTFGEVLKARGIRQVDHIVCGLGTPSLPKESQKSLLRWVCEYLKPEGTFRQLTEIPLFYQSYYKKRFADVVFKFIPRNVPPGGYYICRRPFVAQP